MLFRSGSTIQYSGDSRLGVVGPFGDRIPRRVVQAHDLDRQVRAQPEAVLVPGIGAVAERRQVRLAVLALARAGSRPVLRAPTTRRSSACSSRGSRRKRRFRFHELRLDVMAQYLTSRCPVFSITA